MNKDNCNCEVYVCSNCRDTINESNRFPIDMLDDSPNRARFIGLLATSNN